MPDTTVTVYTPDGKLHVLLGSVTLPSIIRDYAGDDAANLVEKLIETINELEGGTENA